MSLTSSSCTSIDTCQCDGTTVIESTCSGEVTRGDAAPLHEGAGLLHEKDMLREIFQELCQQFTFELAFNVTLVVSGLRDSYLFETANYKHFTEEAVEVILKLLQKYNGTQILPFIKAYPHD